MSHPPAPAHILHVSGHLAGEPLAFLSQATRELSHAGVGQTVLHPGDEPSGGAIAGPLPSGVRRLELAAPRPGPVAFARELPAALHAELESNRYTAVHFHGPLVGLVGGIAMATAALSQRPPMYYSPHTPVSPALLLQRAVRAMAYRPVASGAAEAKLLKRITRREAFAVEAAVDPEYFEVEPAPDVVPLVVTIGHARPGSGADLFAEVAARFQFAGEVSRFAWVGPCEPDLQDLLMAAGVHVTGWLPDHEVRAMLARTRVYVQASRWRKTPRSLLQAMACAVPCVATDAPAHREVLRPGETGFLTADASAMALQIKALVDNPGLCRRTGIAARQDALARFTLPRLRKSLLQLYELDGSTARDEGSPWLAAGPAWPLVRGS